MGGLGHGGAHTSRYVGAARSKGGARACKGQGEGEGKRAHLRPPGRIARWRSASMHRVEEGVEGGGGFRAKVACHNIKRYNADGSACGAVAGGRIRLRGDACPAAEKGYAGRARALPVHVRRSGFEVARSPPWPETLAVVEAVLPRWPSLSKRTTCQGWRAGERGEQAGAQAQPRARTLSPHGQPVSRAGSEKVLATGHRFENTRQESQPKARR